MSTSNFVPELWSRLLLTAFRKNLVFASLVNRDYEGEIREMGDTVKITTPSAVAVKDYSGTVTYDALLSTQQSLIIDQAKYFGFEVSDIDQAQANVSLESTYIVEAAQALADAVDQDLASLYTAAGLADIPVTLASDDLYEALVLAGRRLDEANVPRAGRWVVVSPAGYASLLTNDKFVVQATATGDSIVATGLVGQVAGFTVYTSNNVATVEDGGDEFRKYVYGTNRAITFAEQVSKTETLRREGSFSDAIRGLLVFGRRVIRPNSLGTITATEA